MTITTRILLPAALLTITNPAHAAVQFINAGVNASTYGYIADGAPRFSYAFDSTIQPRDLTANDSLAITRPGTADTLDLRHTTAVDFRDASRFVLTDSSAIAFDIATPGSPGYGQVGTNFYYNFSVDRRVPVLIDYSTAKLINPAPPFPLGGDPTRVFIYRSGDFQSLFEFRAAPNTSGQFVATLDAGTYNIQFLTILNGGPGLPSVFGGASGNTNITGSGRYDVRISVVPEPATWAMLIIGFGLVGRAARRRRAGDIAPRPR